MENEVKKSPLRKWLQMLALAFFLIGLPLGSYVYLKKGYDYHKAAMDELSKDHRMPALADWQILSGEWPDSLVGSMHIVGLLEAGDAQAETAYGQALQRLHEQFDIPQNIRFFTLLQKADSNWVEQFQDAHKLDDPEQLLYLQAAPDQYREAALGFGLDEGALGQLATSPRIAMVDDSLYVRIVYEVMDESQLKRLVEQTAMLLPERKPAKPEVVRETEK